MSDKGVPIDITYNLSASPSELSPLFSENSIWGIMLWENAVSLICKYLENEGKREVEGNVVVELGCGLGVPGIVAGLTSKASKVYLTDREADLEVLSKALQNSPNINQDHLFEMVSFDWGRLSKDLPIFNVAQVILAVECISADVYGVDSLNWLITAIEVVAKKNTPVLLFICSARRENDGLDFVLDKLTNCFKLIQPPQIVKKESNVELYKISLFGNV